jgi:hypothetical protein
LLQEDEVKLAITVKEVVEAFELLFNSLHRKEFTKTLRLNEWGEQELLPLVRTYLLGYFGESLVPEAKTTLPGALTGRGYVDFLVDNVAVEFAVRKPTAAKSNVSASVNSDEIKKLMKHDGLAVLVLFDFSKTPYTEEEIESFRGWPSLGKGNHKKSPFNVAYFYLEKHHPKTPGCCTKNIRVC